MRVRIKTLIMDDGSASYGNRSGFSMRSRENAAVYADPLSSSSVYPGPSIYC